VASGCDRRHAKGSGNDPPGMATLLAFMPVAMPGFGRIWQAMVGRGVAALLPTAIHVGGRATPATNDVTGLCSRPAPDPRALIRPGGRPDAVPPTPGQAVARDGEGATCLIEVQWRAAATRNARAIARRRVCGSSRVENGRAWPRSKLGPIVPPPAALGWAFQADAWPSGSESTTDGRRFHRLAFRSPRRVTYLKEACRGAYLNADRATATP